MSFGYYLVVNDIMSFGSYLVH